MAPNGFVYAVAAVLSFSLPIIHILVSSLSWEWRKVVLELSF